MSSNTDYEAFVNSIDYPALKMIDKKGVKIEKLKKFGFRMKNLGKQAVGT